MSSADEGDTEDCSITGKNKLAFSSLSRRFLTTGLLLLLLQNKETHFRQLNFKDGLGTSLECKMDLLYREDFAFPKFV